MRDAPRCFLYATPQSYFLDEGGGLERSSICHLFLRMGKHIPVSEIRGGTGARTFVEPMAFYSGCSLIVAIPQDYSKKDDLTRFLTSQFEGCEISVVEDPVAKEPFPERVMIREDSQLGRLQGTRDFASPDNPAPEARTSEEFLMVRAGEAIHEFLRDSRE
jgi:hypothetical protein